ncbi:MAG: Sporulation kinase E [Syntrophorhabdus sp. PtaU1.Bin050]|nr:MAG: Sporulation kinase E [Syntrophorhabdus sp. PtaU1.Bin050]
MNDITKTTGYVRDGSETRKGQPTELEGLRARCAQLEKDLEETKARYGSVLEGIRDGVYTLDAEGRFTFVNHVVTERSGYPSEWFIGKSWLDFVSSEDKDRVRANLGSALDGQIAGSCEIRYKASSGETRWIEISATPLRKSDCLTGWFGISRDITERKKAEQALKESEEKYRTLVHASPDDIFLLDLDGAFLMVNERAAELHGFSSITELLSQKSVFRVIAPEHQDKAWLLRQKLLEAGFIKNEEITLLRKDGSTFPAEVNISLIKDHEGQPKVFLGVTRDITERKRAEKALKESYHLFRTVLDSLDASVYVADMNTYEILFANKYAGKIFGDITGHVCWKAIQKRDDGPCPFCSNRRLLTPTGEPGEVVTWESAKNTSGRWYECRDKAIRWPDGRIVRLEIATDITERKHMEAELLKRRNLESIGTLAGGIAHDFNNLLMAVTGYISLARIALPPESEASHLLSEAERIATAGKKLTQKLITFSKGGEPIKKVINLNRLLEEPISIALTGSDIRCIYSLADDPLPVDADSTQIKQVIQNIVLNAREAMPHGGRVKIGTVRLPAGPGNTRPLPASRYARVSIEDEGAGIKKDDLSKVFDPYYTTKGMGARKGMGLGLTVAYSVIKRHNGHLTVESTPGRGTTVHIDLPLHGRETKSKEAGRETEKSIKGRILFMDGEEDIRHMGSKLIDHLGYSAVLARNGNEALSIYRDALDTNGRFDLVILDLSVKKGMGGKETLDQLLTIDPAVRAIIASGFTNDPVVSNYADYGFKGAITKPYMIHEFDQVLQRVLSRGAEDTEKER